MSQKHLQQELLSLSEAEEWKQAKDEWELYSMYMSEEPETCLCKHFPIKELCTLQNKYNHNFGVVGNCCVKKFLGLKTDNMFQCAKRLAKDNTKSLNEGLLRFLTSKNVLNAWEEGFYKNTLRKRKLTKKQLVKRQEINIKVLKWLKVKNIQS